MSVAARITTARPVVAARAFLMAAGLAVLRLVVEYAPVFGRAAVRRRRRIVLAPYKRTSTLWGAFRSVFAGPAAVVLGCTIYGFAFALTAPTFIVPFVVPIAVLAVLIIWALPDQRTAPTAPIEYLLPAFFIFMILWPEYLAISLPGLPWITMLRIIGLPMVLTLLISLSVSRRFRHRVSESVTAVKPLWFFFCGFIAVQVLTIFASKQPFASAQIVFNEQIYWTAIFVISCVMFRDVRYIERYWALLCCLAIPICILTALEFREEHVLWVAHIPKILRIPDPSVQMTLKPSFRPGIHFYRAKATFSTQLAMAEYLALLTPLFLHFGFSRINVLLRVASFAMLPALFLAIRMTDARLGVVGMLASVLLYGMLWSIVRWRTHPRDLLAAATVYGYPAIFLGGLVLAFSSHRMNTMLLGGGAQQGSTDARKDQLAMSMTGLSQAPWGHGAGQSGQAMGFAKDAFITIDNYFISLALDYGVLGVIFWYGIFIVAIVVALRYCLSNTYGGKPEARLLAPLAVTMMTFLLIKWVHGQSDNHAIYFMMVGMICALVYRLRREEHSPAPPPMAAGVAVRQAVSRARVLAPAPELEPVTD